MKTNHKSWTKPYCDVSHYGNISDKYWSTVTKWDSVFCLTKWYPGCVFSPMEEDFNSLEEAKKAGEDWANQNQEYIAKATGSAS